MKKRKNLKKQKSYGFEIAVVVVGLLALILLFSGCAPQPTKIEVKVPTPCFVENKPTPPPKIDLGESTITGKMLYIKQAVKYAKEVAPIMDKCVREGKIKAKE